MAPLYIHKVVIGITTQPMGPTKMNFFKRMLVLCLVLVIWEITTSCRTVNNSIEKCYGYWEDDGPQRGTLLKNRNNMHPYRQCVEETPPYRNL